MRRVLTVLLCLFYPLIALADSALSFTPPSTDYSVIFLGNIFGVVDGVLHGTGSQIMGTMFGVFNAAVLALGGIVVTYTLIVGTMNTSHEGQFLGQKWSSIWIPVRSTIGLALLIPKASGYCLMQIFIMWVVVQGIGAADKIWAAALDYLNLGGVIMSAQSTANPTTPGSTGVENIAKGEAAILMGQVCMKGIQTVLESAKKDYDTAKESGSGPCQGNMSTNMKYFCDNPVPDFLGTVNAVEAYSAGYNSVNMPNFTDGSVYEALNGICGFAMWTQLDMATSTEELDYVSAEDVETLNESRPIGVQQMYMDLMPVATAMVKNDPQITVNSAWDVNKRYNAVAQDQYGVPYLSTTGQPCSAPSEDCMNWNAATGGATQTYIFTGLEFMNTMMDYNAIMMPVLNLMSQSSDADTNNSYHEFIEGAQAEGWIMAGTYFFDLANLNGSVQAHSDDVDEDSGLNGSSYTFKYNNLTDPFNAPCSGTYAIFCEFLNKNVTPATAVVNLITGSNIEEGLAPTVTSSGHEAVQTSGSATTYGYINNSSLIHLPGQPGLETPSFTFNINMVPGDTILKIPSKKFGCGFNILGFCIGGPLASILWNSIFKSIIDIFVGFITNLFNMVVGLLLIAPLTVTMTILNNGVQLLNTTQSHPIIALAYMGTSFINYVISMYFSMAAFSIIFSFGGGMIGLMVMPFLTAWMGIMLTIGFLDAYYVPFLPYMIFTFGSLAWLMAVVESMVAGPIIALGVTHPEGHDALGKAEQAVMILINIFLRPAMMIIGYIAGIALCYVAVFIINSGFSHVMKFLMPDSSTVGDVSTTTGASTNTPYTNYASMFAGFFCLLTYTTMYMTVVEKSFGLIHSLPDNILRWIGGTPEQHGKEAAGWTEGVKKQLEEGGQQTGKAGMEMSEGVGKAAGSKIQAGKDALKGAVTGKITGDKK